ncbi:MAG: ABC transporter permease, partial [Candidatus Hydrogenedentes bacterium]|nr:ABC transporter permease [Candidatus Hydrogenedentota bacterium]
GKGLAFLTALSPFTSAGSFAFMGVGGAGFWHLPLWPVFGQGVFCAIALLVAWKMIRRPSMDRNFSTVPTPPPLPVPELPSAPASNVSIDSSFPVPDAPCEPASNVSYADSILPPWPPVPDRVNPVYAREMLQVRINNRITPLRFVGGLVLVLPVMLILAASLSENFGNIRGSDAALAITTWLIGLMVFMAFVSPAMSATAWSREYERETMDLIRTSLLTPRELVMGKTRAALSACAFPLVLACIASLPLFPYAFAGAHALLQFILGVVSLFVTILLCNAIGTLVGLLNRRSATCVLYGYVCTMTVLALPFLIAVVVLLFWTVTTGFPMPGNPLNFWFFSPIVAYGATFNSLGRGAVAWWAIAMGAHVLLAFFILRIAVRLLAKRHMAER